MSRCWRPRTSRGDSPSSRASSRQVEGQLQHVAGAQGQGQQLLGQALQAPGRDLRRHLLAAFLAQEMGQLFHAELPGDVKEIFGAQHQAGPFARGGMLKEHLTRAGPRLGPPPAGPRRRRLPGPAPGGAPPGVPGGGSGSVDARGRQFPPWRQSGPTSRGPGPGRQRYNGHRGR